MAENLAHVPTGEDLLHVPDVAVMLRRSPETVRHWRKVGYGPRGFRLGRRVVYDRRDVEAFIESQRAAALSEAA